MTDCAAVDTQQLTKSFGTITALIGVTLSIEPGIIYGLLGPSGSGKTTLIRTIVGAVRPSSGSVRVFGRLMPDRALAPRIGYMTQSAALYDDLTLRENLLFFGAIYGLRARHLRRRVLEIAEEVQLHDRLNSPLRTFSGGMRQRASLAVAMIHSPDLILLDEPTVGLDPVLRGTFWSQFRALAESGKAVIVSSHIMDEAERCDKLAFLRDGSVLSIGTPEELRRSTGSVNLEQAFLSLATGTSNVSA